MSIVSGELVTGTQHLQLGRITEPRQLLERFDNDSLDGGIVFIPPPLFRTDLNGNDQRAYAEALNDALLDACSLASSRLRPLAYLPLEEPRVARELALAVGPEWAGVMAGTDLRGRSYADPGFDPLWQHLESCGLPLFIHPSASSDPRLENFYLGNLIGNPFETTTACAHLVLGGVLQRFPGLKVVLAHAGGCIAALAGRLQRGKDTDRPGLPSGLEDPLDLVRRLYVDSIAHSDALLRLVIEVMGEERVLLGSDWPFPMGTPDAGYGLERLGPELGRRFRSDNPVGVFRL
jgi:aminocarboxymuconate-semialdehyde decarboxylase